jgi:biotin transporter BioY
MEWFLNEFFFSPLYFKLSLVAFIILSFLVGVFKEKVENVSDGMPFSLQVVACLLVAIFWPVIVLVIVMFLPGLIGKWLGYRIESFKHMLHNKTNLKIK